MPAKSMFSKVPKRLCGVLDSWEDGGVENCRAPPTHLLMDSFSYRSTRSTDVITRTRGFLLTDMRGEMDQNSCTTLIADSKKPPLPSRSPFLHTPF